MEQNFPRIQEIAGKISGAELRRKRLARFLKDGEKGFGLTFPSAKTILDGVSIAGVDGGIVKRSLHGFDFVLARAVGVCFRYDKGRPSKVEYHPERTPSPELFALEALSESDWPQSASVIRQKLEIRAATETAERFVPDLLLLDGSLIPHYSDRPGKISKVRESYDELICSYSKLFDVCTARGIMLAGVIEDSRGTRFCEIARTKVERMDAVKFPEIDAQLEGARDTSLLFWLLDEGERTIAFPYSSASEDHPVMKDFGKVADRVFSFYLKTAKFDRPVRIDFLCGENGDCEKEADRLAGFILSIASHHSGYGFPSVLIEADQAAKLEDGDIEGVYEQILAQTGPLPGVAKLRRDDRPF
jgi:hypothetical protein